MQPGTARSTAISNSYEIPIVARPRRRARRMLPTGAVFGLLTALVAGSGALALQVVDPAAPVDAVSSLAQAGTGAVQDLSRRLADLLPESEPADDAVVSDFRPMMADALDALGTGKVYLGSRDAPIVVSVSLARTSRTCTSARGCATRFGSPSRGAQSVTTDLRGHVRVQVVQWRAVGSPHADVRPLTKAELWGLATSDVWVA